MTILQSDGICYRTEERIRSSSLNKVDEFRDENFRSGLNSDSGSLRHKHESFPNMLLWLKRVAIDPCNLKASRTVREPWGQILKARKVLFLSNTELPWKKRKLRQLLQETSTVTFDLPPEKPNEQSLTGLSRGQSSFASSIPCLISYTDSADSSEQIRQNPCSSVRSLRFSDDLSRKQVPNSPSCQADALDWSIPPYKEVLPLLDSEDSVSVTNPLSPENPVLQNPYRSVKLLKSGNLPVKRVPVSLTFQPDVAGWSRPPKKEVPLLQDSDDSVNSLNLSSKPKQHQKTRRSVRLLNFIGDYLPRMAIPVGPRFQADVPDWTGPPNRLNSSDGDSNSDSLRWLGTRIWPIEGRNAKTSGEVIGKGRPYSCSCDSPGSTMCIKQHIIKKKLRLQSDLGPAFYSWRFDDMGEEVSKSWTLMEQKSFKIHVKMNPVSKSKSFMKPAMKCFPYKCRESIVSYYFNVFVLRRMSMQTRLVSALVDSDDDEADGHVGSSMGSSKVLKDRYLIRPR